MKNKYLISNRKYKNYQVINSTSEKEANKIYIKINNIETSFQKFGIEGLGVECICLAKIENETLSIMNSECPFKYIKLLLHEKLKIGDVFEMPLKNILKDNG